jgi:hypothetical protein
MVHMARSQQPDQTGLRQIERNLDSFHRGLPFWSRNPARRRFALLGAFDSFHPMKMNLCGDGSVPHAQLWRHLECGLPIALRWVDAANPDSDEFDFTDDELVDAGYFLNHAADYANLTDYFEMLSRSQVSASADVSRNLVRFEFPDGTAGRRSLEGFVNNVAVFKRHRAETPGVSAQDEMVLVLLDSMPIIVVGECLALYDPRTATSRCVQEFAARQWPARSWQLDDSEDLVGFSVAELNRFWHALNAWSFACLGDQFRAYLVNAPARPLPTQVSSRDAFLEIMSGATELPKEVILSILGRLTYDPKRSKANIFYQPFLSTPTKVAWSPSIVCYSRFQRNMLKLMAQLPELKATADNLIGGRERKMLNAFALMLGRRGWQSKQNQEIPGAEIDLLGYRPSAVDEVLIVQGKAVLAVDTIHEVGSATKQFVEAQEQAERCVKALALLPEARRRQLFPFVSWSQVRHYCLLVIAPEAEPNESYDFDGVPFISLDTARTRLRSRDFKSPSALVDACRRRDWHRDTWRGEQLHTSVRVGDMTFEIPAFKPLTA